MPSAVDDYTFIAKRAAEIRAARYQELGVSPPRPAVEPPPPPRPAAAASPDTGGFKYAPGFEHLASDRSP
jgi:hypothetical protein